MISKGGVYFFTLVTYQRLPVFSHEPNISILRDAFQLEQQRRPFTIEAAVILPDHLHCIWQLPEHDVDYPGRWREIKKHVTKNVRSYQDEKVWQRRYWEHAIRDERDWRNHMDYIHYNPVKHGYASSAAEWRWSSFSRWVEKGVYRGDWGATEPSHISGFDLE